VAVVLVGYSASTDSNRQQPKISRGTGRSAAPGGRHKRGFMVEHVMKLPATS
jgi:hypothetical protein